MNLTNQEYEYLCTLARRTEAAEAHTAQAEAACERMNETIKKIAHEREDLRSERDEWKRLYDIADDTAHKNVLRADKLEAKCDELCRQLEQAQMRIAELEAQLKDIAESPYTDYPYEGDEMDALQREAAGL